MAMIPVDGPLRGHCVQVVSRTWTRDSSDLFDFETHQLETKTFTVARPAQLVRQGVDIQAHPFVGGAHDGEGLITLAQRRDGTFYVDRAGSSSSTKRLWLVVKDLPSCSYALSEGDVIKLGCFKFRVRQLSADPDADVQPDLRIGREASAPGRRPQDACEPCRADVDLDDVPEVPMPCRICLLEGGSKEDPLVRPCACKGSIERVHLACLRHWIKGRLEPSASTGGSSGSYYFRALPCELCRTPYPAYCRSEERGREPLVEVPRCEGPFVVLENMMRDTQQHVGRGLHVLSLADGKRVTMGRGHDNNVCIADVSTSRCHATIRFSEGNFILEDNNSKFGTLVSMKKPRLLDAGSPLSIQAGRTVLSISAAPDTNPALADAFMPTLDARCLESAQSSEDRQRGSRYLLPLREQQESDTAA
jgi:hypothetical protein